MCGAAVMGESATSPGRDRVLAASLAYAALAFAGGFVFGSVRELWLRPRFGHDLALTIEAPFMFAVSALAARIALRRFPLATRAGTRLRMATASLLLLLAMEEGLTRLLRGGSLFAYWADFDAWAQAVNVLGLLVFFAMPLLALWLPGRRHR